MSREMSSPGAQTPNRPQASRGPSPSPIGPDASTESTTAREEARTTPLAVTRATVVGETMDWWTVSYRLPAEPSRYRVNAWRRLKRGGAVALQQATWAFPAGPQFDPMVDDVVALVAD